MAASAGFRSGSRLLGRRSGVLAREADAAATALGVGGMSERAERVAVELE